MGHGFIQKPMHQLEDQREAIRKSVEVIRKFSGKAPSGWLGPGLTETPETLDLLAEAGLRYVADWVNDDQPYEIKTAHGPLFSLPYTVELNDIPMMVLQHHEAEEFFRRTKDQFETLYTEGAKSARVMAIAVHPYISGVPHRIKYFEKTFAHLKKQKGVLFWTGEQILECYTSVKKLNDKGLIGSWSKAMTVIRLTRPFNPSLRALPWSSSTRSMTSTVSPQSKTLSPMPGWSSAPKSRQANDTDRPSKRSVTSI